MKSMHKANEWQKHFVGDEGRETQSCR